MGMLLWQLEGSEEQLSAAQHPTGSCMPQLKCSIAESMQTLAVIRLLSFTGCAAPALASKERQAQAARAASPLLGLRRTEG